MWDERTNEGTELFIVFTCEWVIPLKVQADVSVDGKESSLGEVEEIVIFAQQIHAVFISRWRSRSLIFFIEE